MIYRTTFTVTVLSNGPWHDGSDDNDPFDLAYINYAIVDGDCIGTVELASSDALKPDEVEPALLAVGNDGTFFDALIEVDGTVCRHCAYPIVQGVVDYSGTPGWVHIDTDEAKCNVDDEDSPDAESFGPHGSSNEITDVEWDNLPPSVRDRLDPGSVVTTDTNTNDAGEQ